MISPKTLALLIGFTIIFVGSSIQVNAQQVKHFDNGISVGASINYGGIYYESNGSVLNDIWTNSLGYQFHVLYGYNISSVISLNTGAELFVNRYRFEEQRTPETDEQGQPTGDFFTASMKDAVGTTYISVPINLILRPLGNKSFYAVVGPDISFKIAHSNGTIITNFETNSGENNQILFEESYVIPERSKSLLLFANLGVGYSFDTNLLPLNIEIGAKHSITPYMDGDNFITSWIRNLSFTLSYRL